MNNGRTGMKRQNDAKRSCSKVVLRKRQPADSGSAFSYKSGNSPLHRCPAWIKILVLPLVSIAFIELPPIFAATLFLAQIVIAFCLRFTVREQFSDIRAVLYYAAMLLFVKCITLAFSGLLETVVMLLKLLCVMQTASLVFKTSTSLQLREGLEKIELSIRKVFHASPAAPVAGVIALFVCFIPQVSKNWQQVKRAWKARGGKNSIRMYIVLLPVLFSVGMKQAYTTARAISIRKR